MKKYIFICIALLCSVACCYAAAPPPLKVSVAPTYNTELPILAPVQLNAIMMTPAPLLRQSMIISITDISAYIAEPVMIKAADITLAGKTSMPRVLPQCSQPDHPAIGTQLSDNSPPAAIIQKE